MTLNDIMRDIQAMREDLLVFERKYGVPTEIFYEAYRRGEEPDDPAWVLDWSEWAATQQLLQERLAAFNSGVRQLLVNTVRHQTPPHPSARVELHLSQSSPPDGRNRA
jgi:hypothetical protein